MRLTAEKTIERLEHFAVEMDWPLLREAAAHIAALEKRIADLEGALDALGIISQREFAIRAAIAANGGAEG